MNDLLSASVNPHGGLSRWSRLKTVTATLSITDAIWEVKGKPGALKDVSIEAQPQKESLTTHFNGQGKRTVFDPNRITVQTESGRIVSSRNDPRSAFRGHTLHTSWDDMHRGIAILRKHCSSTYKISLREATTTCLAHQMR
jgi:hypothetical protein